MKIFHLWQTVNHIKGFNSKSYGRLSLILVSQYISPLSICLQGFYFVTLTVLEKTVKKNFINGKIVRLSRDVTLKVIDPWP